MPLPGHAAASSGDSRSRWNGTNPLGPPVGLGGNDWGISELWWYNRARAFSSGAEIEVTCPDATGFQMRGRESSGAAQSFFGVMAKWDSPLSAGYQYHFGIDGVTRETLPDFIAIHQQIVWQKDQDVAAPAGGKIDFDYIPGKDGEKVELWFGKKAGQDWSGLFQGHDVLTCEREPFSGPRPAYPAFTLPADAKFQSIDPTQACTDLAHPYDQPAEIEPAPLPPLTYPPANLTILERSIPVMDGARFYQEFGLDYAQVQPDQSSVAWAGVFNTWADKAAATGAKNILLAPRIEVRCFNPKAPPDLTYWVGHIHSLLSGRYQWNQNRNSYANKTPAARQALIDSSIETTAQEARYWLEKVPNGKVLIFEVEMNGSFSPYGAGVEGSLLQLVPGNEVIASGGRPAWERSFAWFNDYRDKMLKAIGPEWAPRVQVIANFDRAAFQGAYAYKSGVDIIVFKNIHRQSINVVVANSRGGGRAYGKPYGFDFDSWDRNYWGSYHPDEIREGLLVYFHAGGTYLMNEIKSWDAEAKALSGWGAAWLDSIRYMRSHPRLGRQQVRIAVMRPLGDDWNRVTGPSAGGEAGPWLPSKTIKRELTLAHTPWLWYEAKQAAGPDTKLANVLTGQTYLADYDLLDLLFAQFGNASRTDANRLCTGTPFGPVDFIPWDTPLERLKTYRVILCLGRGVGADHPTVDNLEAYVRQGGSLALAAGQLRGDDDEFIKNDFLGAKLGATQPIHGIPQTALTPPSGTSEKQPSWVRFAAGQGQVLLSAGEWLDAVDPAPLRQALAGLLSPARWLTFNPESTWLEYMVQRKNDTWVFPLFNHGRGSFPSKNGVDHGPWTGTIQINLDTLGLTGQSLTVLRAVYSPTAKTPFTLVHVPFSINGSQLSATLTVGQLEELVIGPAATAESDYFQ